MPKPPDEPRPAPRKARGAATRERLIHATIDLLREEGAAAVTTVRVTRAAGIVQSGFYLHFKNIDECKRVAAERVADSIRRYVAERRRDVRLIDPDDVAPLRDYYEQILGLFLAEGRFTEVFLRHRHDASSLGEVIRRLRERLHADLVADMWHILSPRGLTRAQRPRLKLQAALILASVLEAGEMLVDGRAADPRALAELLAVNTFHSTRALFPKSGDAS